MPVVDVQQDVSIGNDTVTVPIHISNNCGIMGMRLRVSFDGAKFNLLSCERGATLNGGMFDYLYNSGSGTVDILWSSAEASYVNDVCCVLKVRIQDQSAQMLALSFGYEPEDTFDERLENVALDCESVEIPLHRMVILADASSINVGETIQLTAEMLYAENEIAYVRWVSGNADIASVDETGLVRGLSRGIAIVTADDGNGHTCSISIQVMPIKPELQIFSFNGAFEQKIDWWKRYSTASMTLSYVAYKCEDAVRFEWSSDSTRVHIDRDGNVTNTGWFARSAKITLTAYDAQGNVIAASTVTVRFYKFNWQYRRLQSQEVVSDNVFRPTIEPTATEPETLVSFVTAFFTKVFWLFIK